MPLHRFHLVELLGSFLPRMSNEVAFRLVVKLAEGFNYRRFYWHKRRRCCQSQTFSISPKATDFHQTTPNPSHQKFGVSLIRLDRVVVRIYGEWGASIEKASAGQPSYTRFKF